MQSINLILLDYNLFTGDDAIVLSAFGCGAYGNPPKHVSWIAIYLTLLLTSILYLAFVCTYVYNLIDCPAIP